MSKLPFWPPVFYPANSMCKVFYYLMILLCPIVYFDVQILFYVDPDTDGFICFLLTILSDFSLREQHAFFINTPWLILVFFTSVFTH